jgi:hypothetical protein
LSAKVREQGYDDDAIALAWLGLDYVEANRNTYPRADLDRQLMASGWTQGAIRAIWDSIGSPPPVAASPPVASGPLPDMTQQVGPSGGKRKFWTPTRILGLLALGVVVIVAINQLGDGTSGSPPTSDPTGNTVTDTSVDLVYQLGGSARSADLTYTDGAGNIQQQTGVAVPLKTQSGAEGISFTVHRGDFVQFSAQNQGASGNLRCSIVADGQVINTGNASGGYAIVSCSATVP